MKSPGEMLSLRLENSFQKDKYLQNDDDSWVLSLSDLMSLLLIFFLVWTTLKISELKKQEAVPAGGPLSQMSFSPNPEALEGLKDTLLEFSPSNTADGSIVIVLEEDISFDPGSARLSEEGKLVLERIAKKLKTGTHYRIRVLGHTDSQPVSSAGTWTSNFDLSMHRAASAASRLIACGIPPGRIMCQGFGDLYPARDKDKIKDKRFNRRVELVIEPS